MQFWETMIIEAMQRHNWALSLGKLIVDGFASDLSLWILVICSYIQASLNAGLSNDIETFEAQQYLIFLFICIFFVELAEILFVDTTPFVKAYFTDAEGHTYDWRGVHSRKAYTANLLKVYYRPST